jgi:alpha-galactosidase
VEVDLPGVPRRYYQHGWHSWSDTRWLDPTGAPLRNPVEQRWPMVDDPAHATSEHHGGSAVGAVDLGPDGVLLLGALDLGGRVELDGERLVGRYEQGEGDWLVEQGTESEVFGRYAEALGHRLGRRAPRHPRIWCSWYSFYSGITEARLHEVLDDVTGMPFDVFQIDDGWQRGIGDWRANEDFPSGMAALATRIRAAGFEPGLWLAPFLVRADAVLVERHPEVLARDDDGEPVFAGINWGGPCFALDLTHPVALEIVAETMTRAVDDGFTYLKLDFLYAAALPGRRHADVQREQVYRDAVELIRNVVGDEVYLLACGAPIVPSVGVFDAIRVGPDVAPWWDMPLVTQYLHDPTAPSTRFAIATSVNRLWLAPLIEPDPDVVYFRRRYNLLSRRERAMLQDLATVCGFRATSDPPAWLDDRERAEMVEWFAAEPSVVATGRLRFAIDQRDVDFHPVADADPGFVSWL